LEHPFYFRTEAGLPFRKDREVLGVLQRVRA
jgi:hypothetical protein